MAQTSGTLEGQRITILLDILAHMAEFDSSSEAATSLWVSRFLEHVNQSLDLAGSAVLVSTGKEFNLLAKHGPTGAEIDCAVAQLKGAAAPPVTSGTGAGKDAVSGGRQRQLAFAFDGNVATAFQSRLPDSRALWSVFLTPQEPSEPVIDMLRLVCRHLTGLVEGSVLRRQLAQSAESAQQTARELKEMQVCSLNIMEDLQRKNRDLSALNRISREITSRTSLSELAQTAVGAIAATFDGACVGLYVTDPATSCYIPYFTAGQIAQQTEDLRVSSSGDLATQLAKGEEIVFDTAKEMPALPLARAVDAKSGVIVPLHSKGNILGFIVVCEARWHRVFTEDERENLRVLTATLSVAIENATLLTRTAGQVEEMNLLTEYIETVVDSVDLSVMVVGSDFKIGMINRGFERMYGRPRDQFIGKHLFQAFPHLIEQGFEEIARQVFDGKPFVRFGWRRATLGGRESVQNIRIFPHRAASGVTIGAIVIIEDITEKAALEAQLAKSEAKFQSLVEDLGDGYLILTQGRVVYANRAASNLSGIPASELLGIEIGRALSDEELVAECTKPTGKKIRRESRLIHSTGTWIPVELSLNTCEYSGSQSVSVVVRDVTERKKFEKQLELKNREMSFRNEQVTRLNSELEAIVNKLKDSQENLIKSERLAAITETSVAANHEINNPLFSILGQAQLLLRKYTDQDEDTVHRLRMIEESALRIACVTKKLANLADPVVKEYAGLPTSMIDVDKSTTK
jgi:PAS domain S-box-containing protein